MPRRLSKTERGTLQNQKQLIYKQLQTLTSPDMMKSKISFICTAAIILIVTSCGQQQAWDGGLISVQYDRLPQGEDILLSDWVGEPEFIALDSSDPEALIDGGEITVSDRYTESTRPGKHSSSSSTEPPASSCAISATSDAVRENTPEYLSHR